MLRAAVERAAGLHVPGHVGDRDQQPPAARAECPAPHRVVKIPRVLAVNRHKRNIPQIDALAAVLFEDTLRKRLRLLPGRHVKLGGQPEAPCRHFDFHRRIVGVAQDFRHLGAGRRGPRRLPGDVGHHRLPGNRVGGRELHRDMDLRVGRLQDEPLALFPHGPDNLPGVALNHLLQLNFHPAAGIAHLARHQHAVAGKAKAFRAGLEDILHVPRVFIGFEKKTSGARADRRTGQPGLGRSEAELAVLLHSGAAPEQLIEPPVHLGGCPAALRVAAQRGQFLPVNRHPRLSQDLGHIRGPRPLFPGAEPFTLFADWFFVFFHS